MPAQSVHGDGNNAHVYVMSGGRYEERAVRLGKRSPDLIELLSGVEPGERVSLVTPADVAL